MRSLRRLLLIACIALILGVAWLLCTSSGLRSLSLLANQASAGRLQIDGASGRVIGPLSIERLRWHSPGVEVQATQLVLEWSPRALWQARVQVQRLHAASLAITPLASEKPNAAPVQVPEDVRLPLQIQLDSLRIEQLSIGEALKIQAVQAALSSSATGYRLESLHAKMGDTALQASATLGALAPLLIRAEATLSSRLAEHPVSVAVQAEGPLAALRVQAQATEGLTGSASLQLAPFASQVLSRAQISLDKLNPQAWQRSAPQASLSVKADLAPSQSGFSGQFSVRNEQAGRLDQDRLPLSALSASFAQQGDGSVQISRIQAALPGAGRLSGSGRWQSEALQLDLAVQALNLLALDGRLRSSALSGTLATRLGSQRQDLRLQLSDAQQQVQAELSHSGDQITVTQLALRKQDAQLSAQGRLSLNAQQDFQLEGTLRRFDPSLFFATPAAQINATFSATGVLAPQPQVQARFVIEPSRVAQQPLSGHGELELAWPVFKHVALQLDSGANRLTAQGAFGGADDRLQLDLAAPRLDLMGVRGAIDASFVLSGGPQQPLLQVQLASPQLSLPDRGVLKGLAFAATLGTQPEAPLAFKLGLARFDSPAQSGVVQAVQIESTGSNRAHTLRFQADLEEIGRLSLAAEGGLALAAEPAWQGRLLAAQLTAAETTRNLQLDSPAELRLSAQQWSFGPAKFSNPAMGWGATGQATAQNGRLQAVLKAVTEQASHIDAQLNAGLIGVWALDTQAPWQGQLDFNLDELRALPALLDQGWQSGGKLKGRLNLSGSPAKRRLEGQLNGENLALRLPEQGLDLANGRLDAQLDSEGLHLRELSFDSLLRPAPRTLRLARQNVINRLTESPGRLSIRGDMPLKPDQTPVSGSLELQFDRVGAYQLPEQWLMLSGKARLNWLDQTVDASGDFNVEAAYWQLAPAGAPRLSDDVVVRRSQQAKPEEGFRPAFNLDLNVDLGRNFYFQGAGLRSELVGKLRLLARKNDLPRATGTISLRNGVFEAYGQKLTVASGDLSFQGLLDNPTLNVRAIRKGLAIEPGVQISGSVEKPVITLVSEPELPEAEKLTWLVLGHGPETLSPSDAGVLVSAASGLLGNNSGGLVAQLKNTLGIDEIGVRQGTLGEASGRRSSSRIASSGSGDGAGSGEQIFQVGTRLSSNTVLSYEQALGNAESLVKLTIELSRRFSLVARAGSDNALDLFYTLTFGHKTPEKTR